ncbi:MAG: hypothetical protein AAGB51_14800 [Planctomycetota bacterium]
MQYTTRTAGAIVALALLALPAAAQDSCQAVPPNGARILFAGHSFFIPISREFDEFVLTGIDDTLGRHITAMAPYGGGSGSPASLWDNTDGSYDEVVSYLEQRPDVFGMTLFREPDTGLVGHATVDDYVLWFDLARTYRQDMQFFVAMPWPTHAHEVGPVVMAEQNLAFEQEILEVIGVLRQMYPDNRIDFYNHGITSVKMYEMYEAGELPDITCLIPEECGPDGSPLFTDSGLGHASPMMRELCSVGWLDVLYGIPYTDVAVEGYLSDTDAILAHTAAHNGQLPRPPQDWDRDGACTFFDVIEYLRDFDAADPTADVTIDGVYDAADVELVVEVGS